MVKEKFSINLINHVHESFDKKDSIKIAPELSVEEENGVWWFKDSLGNKIKTTPQTIYDFVFCASRIKVFGLVYFYPVYIPPYKPPKKQLDSLRLKLL